MDADHAYEQWARDAETLAALGLALVEQPTRVLVTLPARLAATAQAAWERDGYDGDLPVETRVQHLTRSRAAALALIGLAVGERGRTTTKGVVVDVDASAIGRALDAAEDEDQMGT